MTGDASASGSTREEGGSPKRAKSVEEGLGKVLEASTTEEEAISILDDLIETFGVEALQAWKDARNKHKHRLIHAIACKGWCAALEHLAVKHKFDLNVQRESDLCTAAHLAIWYKKEDVLWKLWELKADTAIANKYGDTADAKWKEERDKYQNLIFLDLEMTSGFYDRDKNGAPKILEAAIVVTDKNLSEKGRGQWVVGGYSKEQLKALGEFHQEHFSDAKPGGDFPPLEDKPGNGLFADLLKSSMSLKGVEDAMLALVRKHCPEHGCPLVGYSVQCDREVLMLEMPRFYAYLNHQIVDLSSFLRMGGIWLPEKMKARQGRQSNYNHRALNDVEDSIQSLAWIRENLFQSAS